ncbi:unnamed protein product, partial [Brenthis ino]
MNFPMKREFEEFNSENKDQDNSFSDANSETSDVENNPSDEGASTALDYTENTLSLHPVADFIKKEFLPELDFANPFRNQNLSFKDGFQNARSPFLLPTQLYKSFLATLGKRRRNVADCYSLYSRNMLFSNSFLETSDDENNTDRISNSPDEKAGASSAFVWSGGGVTGGGGQEQAPAQPAAVPTGTSGGGGAQGLVHWMSVMAEHMGGGHHDPSHYALPPWNNGGVDHCQQKDSLDYAAWSRPRGTMTIKQGYEAKMSTGDGTVGGHQKADDRIGHHQSMSQMLYGAGLGPGSSSSSPVGGTNTSGLLVVPQPLGKGPSKLQPLHTHARKYHCKMCPQV